MSDFDIMLAKKKEENRFVAYYGNGVLGGACGLCPMLNFIDGTNCH